MSTPELMTRPHSTAHSAAVNSLDTLSTEDFLLIVGQRVRKQRAQKSMSRKRPCGSVWRLGEISGAA